eukprot:CAMPEP_0174899920 /NCGR_PEP_ID=MMETSP0167-20121228/29191_1 /TAXON_ID=38298 /ORGANISM="Rhodella maculata, Strain CCMP736" /LENGTH=40 /DNA_ID= /DNA_START= /DNA_END= /DNA_ORIENTATION=
MSRQVTNETTAACTVDTTREHHSTLLSRASLRNTGIVIDI